MGAATSRAVGRGATVSAATGFKLVFAMRRGCFAYTALTCTVDVDGQSLVKSTRSDQPRCAGNEEHSVKINAY